MRKIKSFDPACYTLAEHFMVDEPWLAQQPERTAELASHIQEAIEDWFAAQPGIVEASAVTSTECGGEK